MVIQSTFFLPCGDRAQQLGAGRRLPERGVAAEERRRALQGKWGQMHGRLGTGW